MPLILKAGRLAAAEGFGCTWFPFALIPYAFEDYLFIFCSLRSELMWAAKSLFTGWKKGTEEMPQSPEVEFPTSSLLGWKGAELGVGRLRGKAAPSLPSAGLGTETGGCAFLFPSRLLAEKCSFERTEIIYKAQPRAANSIG